MDPDFSGSVSFPLTKTRVGKLFGFTSYLSPSNKITVRSLKYFNLSRCTVNPVSPSAGIDRMLILCVNFAKRIGIFLVDMFKSCSMLWQLVEVHNPAHRQKLSPGSELLLISSQLMTSVAELN